VIDADYRGPVMVLLFNHSDTDFEGMSFPRRLNARLTSSQPKRPNRTDDPGTNFGPTTSASRGELKFDTNLEIC